MDEKMSESRRDFEGAKMIVGMSGLQISNLRSQASALSEELGLNLEDIGQAVYQLAAQVIVTDIDPIAVRRTANEMERAQTRIREVSEHLNDTLSQLIRVSQSFIENTRSITHANEEHETEE